MTNLASKTIVQVEGRLFPSTSTQETGMMARLGDLILTGLAHCCCAHYSMHPDLLGLSGQPARQADSAKADKLPHA